MRSNASIFSSVPGDLDDQRPALDVDDLRAEDLDDLHDLGARAPSTAILNSASSRATVSPGSRSRIFSTLTSLCSCLVTWSIGCIAPSSVSVMREIASSSVGPTASVSMLNAAPREQARDAGQDARLVLDQDREDVLAPRAQAARRLEVLEADSSSFVPGSPIGSPHHVPRGLAGRDHRVHVLLAR